MYMSYAEERNNYANIIYDAIAWFGFTFYIL